jgi:hypothetical protein
MVNIQCNNNNNNNNNNANNNNNVGQEVLGSRKFFNHNRSYCTICKWFLKTNRSYIERLRPERSGFWIPSGVGDVSSPIRPERVWSAPSFLFDGYWSSFVRVKWPWREFDQLSVVPNLRMGGAVLLPSLYAFVEWTGLTFTFFQVV